MDNFIKTSHNLIKKFPIIGKLITEEFIRFFIIGFAAFLIAYLLNNILIFVFSAIIDPGEAERAAIVSISYIIAFIISFIFNFHFSRKWTFKSTSPNYKEQVTKFLIINIFNAIAGAIIISALDYVGIIPLISQPFIIAVQMFWSYFVYKVWVFKE
jgi:putative flippase GtrA